MKVNQVILALLCSILFSINSSYAQKKVEWTETTEVTLESFKGTAPEMVEDNVQQYLFSCTWQFNFQMANIQFAFSKNFNKYVEAFYYPNQSWIEEGELTKDLLLMANLDFDITELFARKFRKAIYEKKKVDSSVNMMNTISEEINYEHVNYRAKIESELRATDNIEEVVAKYDKEVNEGIQSLNEFCKTCKPQKKKRKKKRKG